MVQFGIADSQTCAISCSFYKKQQQETARNELKINVTEHIFFTIPDKKNPIKEKKKYGNPATKLSIPSNPEHTCR